MLLQQMDYLTFIDLYHARIKAFHVKDAEFRPSGRSGVYGGYQPWINRAGRFRSLGDGQIDFKGIFSKLTQYDYDGWAVLEWECCLKDGDTGASEGSEFIRRHIIPVSGRAFDDFAAGAAMINVGIIGSGFIGPAHIEALRRLGFVQVVALCDGSLVKAQEKARQLNVPHAYASVEELLAHSNLHAVHNCTPNHLHAEINRQILRAEQARVFEKPLCMTPDEARELVALAEQAGVVHGVSFVYRQFAMVRRAASMMRAGTLGRLFASHGSYLQDWMLLETDYNWRVDAALGGASRAVADIGSHWCDTVQYVTGRRITEVMADLSIVWPTRKANVAGSQTFTHDEHAHYEDKLVTTEDFGSVLLRFDDGSKGSFSVSQVSAGRKTA